MGDYMREPDGRRFKSLSQAMRTNTAARRRFITKLIVSIMKTEQLACEESQKKNQMSRYTLIKQMYSLTEAQEQGLANQYPRRRSRSGVQPG